MKNLLSKATVASLLLLLLTTHRAEALAQGPLASLKKTNTQINSLLAKESKAGTAQAKRIDQKLKKTVNAFLDFRELARRSLGKHWKGRSPAEQAEFVDILRQLIERNYLKQARKNKGYNVDYRQEKVAGKKAVVTTAIKVKKRRRVEEVLVLYKMRQVKGRWMVYDVITDDVSIVRNYRSQFNRIIKKKSYKALVDKMRRKLRTT